MKDNIIKWEAGFEIPSNSEVLKIIDDTEGLKILLKELDSKRVFQIFFSDSLAYRNMNESYLLKIWSSIDDNILGNILYKIENSSYIDYFNDMSLGLYSSWEIKHYAIHTGQDCIDVLTTVPPVVEYKTAGTPPAEE